MKKIKWFLIGAFCIAFFLLTMYARTGVYRQDPAENSEKKTENTAPPEHSGAIILHYHERKPYYFTTNSGVRGALADKAAVVFEKAGIPFQWQSTPPGRQLDIIKQNKGMECALGWFKNPDREKFAQYTLPIHQDKPTVALARADNDRVFNRMTVKKLFNDRGLRMLRKDGYSYGKFIDQKILQYKPREVLTMADNLGMLKMIHLHRADYFFIAMEEAKNLIKESSFRPSDFKLVNFSGMPKGNKRYIICTPMVPEPAISKLNHAIKKYIHNASIQN